MKDKRIICSTITLLAYFASNLSYATPETIASHADYKDVKIIIEKQGREATINHIVALQKEIIKKHGGHIDEFTEAISLLGLPTGMHQKLELKVDEMLREINKERLAKGKSPVSRARLAKEMQEGGAMYTSQARALCSTPGPRAAIDSGIGYTMAYYDTTMTFIGSMKFDSHACLKVEMQPTAQDRK